MSAVIKSRIIKIGNSQGIRIPKALLDQSGLKEEVELEADAGQIIIRPAEHPRAGWEEQFRAMAQAGEDKLLDPDLTGYSKFDKEEWEW